MDQDQLTRIQEALAGYPNIIRIREGYRFRNGLITDERAAVVSVRHKVPEAALTELGLHPIPREAHGIPIDVRSATVGDYLLEGLVLVRDDAGPRQRAEVVGRDYKYRKPSGIPLATVCDRMRVVCHAGPDAGWSQLSTFLEDTRERLTVGMFELTAPHIVRKLGEVMTPPERRLLLAIQGSSNIGSGTKANDLDEETVVVPGLKLALGRRLDFAWIPVGNGGLVSTSYHIKLAVRDGTTFWLSSGSWQSSNQPEEDPFESPEPSPRLLMEHNREWHVIVENESLAQTLEKYIEWDVTQARELPRKEAGVRNAFLRSTEVEVPEAMIPPAQYTAPLVIDREVRVTPILTPDGYVDAVLPLIQSAKQQLYIQNQSLWRYRRGSDQEHFRLLLDAVLAKQREGLDVKILVRAEYAEPEHVERLQEFGLDTSCIRFQARCHNKGIIVDGVAVLIGSHNWTNAGTAHNRDASLLFEDTEIATYYQSLFQFDWNHMSAATLSTETLTLPADLFPTEIPAGFEAFGPDGLEWA